MKPLRPLAITPLLFTAALLMGCPDEQVSHQRVPKDASAAAAPRMGGPMSNPPMAAPPPAAAPPADAPAAPEAAPSAAAAPAPPPGMKGEVPTPPKPSQGEGITWTLPAGWKQTLTSGVRYATLEPANATAVEASVVVLPGPAGGELANVNRWRSTLGLAPLEVDGLVAVRKNIDTKVGPVALYDFSSDGNVKTRLVAGLVVVDGSSWFFKMTGEAGAVGSAQPGFTQLLASLRPNAPAN